ncbi:MAG: hypothetical protein NTX55_00045, partial [Candidatus Parcubacteria bacterium]|nr:hypothetical protein [Candidatus Parcubacteria bacterium]
MFDFFFYLYLFLPIIAIGLVFFIIFYRRQKKYVEFQQSLYFILYEIALPHEKPKENEKDFKNLIGVMDQFYKGLMAIESYFVLEIGLPVIGKEIVFYAAVERKQSHLFEKLAQGLFPQAQISVKTNDYNIFKPEGFSLGSLAELKKEEILPIRTYDKFESDPLQLIINTFSKLKDEGEGAALQIIVSPADERINKRAKNAAAEIQKGKPLSKIKKEQAGLFMGVLRETGNLIFGPPAGGEKKPEQFQKPVDEETFKLLEAKASRQMMKTNIRLLASSENKKKGESILAELESAFLQFNEAQGNGFQFVRPRGRKLKDLFYKFSFRIPDKKSMFTLNTAELASIFHFPLGIEAGSAPQLKYLKTKEAPPPL